MSVHQVHARFKMRLDRHLVKIQMSEIWIHDSGLQSSALSDRSVCLQQLHIRLKVSCPVFLEHLIWVCLLFVPIH